MKSIIKAINEWGAIFESYFFDILRDPLKYGVQISYFILCFGASAWLILYSLNFVKNSLGM
jgi:hypothetical protein